MRDISIAVVSAAHSIEFVDLIIRVLVQFTDCQVLYCDSSDRS
jgi:hypothetical protein